MAERFAVEARKLGGADNPEDYRVVPQPLGCDKGSHKKRSLHHSPQHKRHWKKVKK